MGRAAHGIRGGAGPDRGDRCRDRDSAGGLGGRQRPGAVAGAVHDIGAADDGSAAEQPDKLGGPGTGHANEFSRYSGAEQPDKLCGRTCAPAGAVGLGADHVVRAAYHAAAALQPDHLVGARRGAAAGAVATHHGAAHHRTADLGPAGSAHDAAAARAADLLPWRLPSALGTHHTLIRQEAGARLGRSSGA